MLSLRHRGGGVPGAGWNRRRCREDRAGTSPRIPEAREPLPRPPGLARLATLTARPSPVATLASAMPERRILETTQLLGALAARRRSRRCAGSRPCAPSPATRCCSARASPPSELFGIVSGRIAILTRSPDGRESLVAVLEEGALFGELGLFDDGPRSADARALEETERHRARLRAGARRDRRAARRCCGSSCACSPAGCAPPTRRSPTRCSSTCPPAPPSACSRSPATRDQFRLPMTQEDLAGLVGASRERVNKALVAVHPARLDRGRGPQPLPDPRPPGAARATPLLVTLVSSLRVVERVSRAAGRRGPGARRRRRRRPGARGVRGRARTRAPPRGRRRSRSRAGRPTRRAARRCRPRA